jgi:hypothetical protein
VAIDGIQCNSKRILNGRGVERFFYSPESAALSYRPVPDNKYHPILELVGLFF